MNEKSKISVEQKKAIVDFMERNTYFARETASKIKTGPIYHELWNQLTLILNKMPGPKKDKLKWQKVWSDIKKALKCKMKKIKIYQENRSGQSNLYSKLTDMDERIIAVMKYKPVGDSSLYESNKNKKPDNIAKLSENVLNAKIKQENSLHEITSAENMDSSINPMLGEQTISTDDGEYSETTFENNSNLSWNSHDNRTSHEDEKASKILEKRMESMSLQLEQIIEQNSVTNILLERIASSLESKDK